MDGSINRGALAGWMGVKKVEESTAEAWKRKTLEETDKRGNRLRKPERYSSSWLNCSHTHTHTEYITKHWHKSSTFWLLNITWPLPSSSPTLPVGLNSDGFIYSKLFHVANFHTHLCWICFSCSVSRIFLWFYLQGQRKTRDLSDESETFSCWLTICVVRLPERLLVNSAVSHSPYCSHIRPRSLNKCLFFYKKTKQPKVVFLKGEK